MADKGNDLFFPAKFDRSRSTKKKKPKEKTKRHKIYTSVAIMIYPLNIYLFCMSKYMSSRGKRRQRRAEEGEEKV